MKITNIRVTNARFSTAPDTLKNNLCTPTSGFRDTLSSGVSWFGPVALGIVEVITDEEIVGVGSVGGFTSLGAEIIGTYFRQILLGEDPFNVELIQSKLYRSSARFGRKGAVVAAISAIDIACWDIMGKALNQPVYRLIGGKTQSRVRAYASRLYALDDLGALGEEARSYKAQGFTCVKQRFGFGPVDGAVGMRRNEALVRTVREAVGEDIELAADAYMGWDLGYALEMEKRLRPYNLSWIEEPFAPDEIDNYVRLRSKAATRISLGEHEYSLSGFKDLIARGAGDILQPDTNRVGGITTMRKICALAEAAGLPVIPHSNEAHNLHIIVSQTVCPIVEYFPKVEPDTGNELFWKLFEGEPEAVEGYVTPTDRPGLGYELKRDTLKRLAV